MRRWGGAMGGLVEVEVRHFDEEDRARAWLGASVTSERPVIEKGERPANGRSTLQPRD